MAADIVREARQRAGFTQTELAERAGVEQSVVSAYENDRRAPSLPMLRRLTSAAGFELSLELVPLSPLNAVLQVHRTELIAALRGLGASHIRVFGSVARSQDGPHSDIDLLVDVDDSIGLFALSAMTVEAERILGVPVDVVPANGLKAEFADQILAEAIEI